MNLLPLEFQDGLTNVLRAVPALPPDVLEDRLAGGGLRQRPDGIGKVPPESRLSPAVLLVRFAIGVCALNVCNRVKKGRNRAR